MEISSQALNYQPWASAQGCFPSHAGSSVSTAAVPVPGTPTRPPGMVRAIPALAGRASGRWELFQRMGVTRTGLSHPSHPALIGSPASEAME